MKRNTIWDAICKGFENANMAKFTFEELHEWKDCSRISLTRGKTMS